MPTALLLLTALFTPLSLGQILDHGLFDPDGRLDEAALRRELGRLCAAEEPVACLLLQGPVDDLAIEAECVAGDPDACAVMAWRARELPAAVARARQRTACALGGGLACVVAATYGAASPGEAVRIAEAACREGHPLGCLLRADLEPDRRVRRAQLEALCLDGDRRGCQRAAQLAPAPRSAGGTSAATGQGETPSTAAAKSPTSE